MLNSDIVVANCGDCPLLDPTLIDLAVETFLVNGCDMVVCGAKRYNPQGTEVQVFYRSALEEIEQRSNDSAHREHVCQYSYEHLEQYNIIHLVAPKDLQYPKLRFQLD